MATKAKLPLTKITIAGVLYSLVFATGPESFRGSDGDNRCGGVELWAQKVLVDNGAGKLVKDSKSITLSELTRLNTDEERTDENERLVFELRIVTVKDVFITKVILEDDNDYHLVLEDGKKNTLIAEIPDPKCGDAKRSKYRREFAEVRNEINKYATTFRHCRFEVSGVLFKDRSHGQTGRAPNDLEIHPILKLKAKPVNY